MPANRPWRALWRRSANGLHEEESGMEPGMERWSDQTIRVASRAEVEIAPDGDVHLTWIEPGVSLTLILSVDEARDLMDALDRKTHRAGVAS